MKASELIMQLAKQIEKNGDLDLFYVFGRGEGLEPVTKAVHSDDCDAPVVLDTIYNNSIILL